MRTVWFVLLWAVLAAASPAAKFETDAFRSLYRLHSDRSVDVEETITVRFLERQHGLIRRIPFRTQGSGTIREVGLELVGVELSRGGGWVAVPVQETTSGGDWELRIGDPNRWQNGRVAYRIRYRVRGALTRFESDAALGPHDELLWNVLPMNWPTSIGQASVEVTFPQVQGLVRARMLVGARGSRDGAERERGGSFVGNAALVDLTYGSPERLVGLIKRTLQPNEGATLVLGLPLAAFEAPSALPPSAPAGPADAAIPIADEPIPFHPLGALIPLLPAGFFWWCYRNALSRRRRPLVVRFEAPEGVGPSEAGFLMDGKVGPGDIVAAIVGLAQKGAGRLIHDGGEIRFEVGSLKDAAAPSDSDRRLFAALEPFRPVVTAEQLAHQFDGYYALQQGIEQDLIARGWVRADRNEGCGCLVFLAALAAVSFVSFALTGLPTVAGIVAALGVGLAVVLRTTPLTNSGSLVHAHLLGLKEFIARAHQKQLNYMVERAPDQTLFEELLPFAIAFGLVEAWTRAFEGMGLRKPDWFAGPEDGLWTAMLVSDLDTFESTWSEAVASTGSHDSGSTFSSGDSGFGGSWSDGGFDGGASSGDGGGGGGGDSW